MNRLLSSLISIALVLSIFNTGQANRRLNAPSTLPATDRRGASIRFAPRQIREANRRQRYTIKARYPQAMGAAGDARLTKLNQELRKFIEKELKSFRADAAPPEGRTFSAGSTFDSRYEVEYAANDVVSLGFVINTYFEGAIHGNYQTISFNYDLNSDRVLALKELFKPDSNYLKLISDYAIASLKKELSADPDFDWIKSGAGPEEKNYQSWNITRKGLVITFDPYQVASYAEGPHEVVIPYSVLKNVIDPNGPLDRIKN